MSTHTVKPIASGEYSCSCGAIWDRDEGSECPAISAAQVRLSAEVLERLNAAPAIAEIVPPVSGGLSVWVGAMPESNGKSNFTALLYRKAEAIGEGVTITLARSEYPDRVRYEADRVRYLIGELEAEPFILDYEADKHSGYTVPAPKPDRPKSWGCTKPGCSYFCDCGGIDDTPVSAQSAGEVPAVLFDGFAVYSALSEKAKGRTSPENVCDTLDAAVRLIRDND